MKGCAISEVSFEANEIFLGVECDPYRGLKSDAMVMVAAVPVATNSIVTLSLPDNALIWPCDLSHTTQTP